MLKFEVLRAKTIVFIDSAIADCKNLMAGVIPGAEAIALDPQRDGLEQISEVLRDRSGVNSVHIVSHGSPGSLQLGNAKLSQVNLGSYAKGLQQWSNALSADADILLYGCRVAAGETGKTFVQQLSQLTGADIAASDDLTGNTAKGGNWDLEVKTGQINSPLAFEPSAIAAYNHLLPLNFGSSTNGTGILPISAAVGNFNGDINPDLAVANVGSNEISILLGNGTGGFSAATNFDVGSSPNAVVAGDFNGDNNQDLAVAIDLSNSISILLGNGTGSFSTPTDFATGVFPISIATGNFNADTFLDLAVANNGSDSISILLGNGTGGFIAPTDFAVGTFPYAVTVGNFNADTFPDLAVANEGSDNISILLGNGTGGFSVPANFAVGSNPYAIAVGNFNADTFPDLAVANNGSNNISILLGNGTGGFTAAANIAVGTSPYSVVAGNFNADTFLDLAVANAGSDSVSILLGNGAGGFGVPADFAAGSNPSAIAVGNFNADTYSDLAVANYASNNVSILLNTSTSEPPVINLPGAALSYTENAAATAIDSTATVTDPDSANFNTGTLTVSYSVGGTADDRLTVSNIGNITVVGTDIRRGGTSIGTITANGVNGTNLAITLNANATPAFTRELLQSISYSNTSDNPAASRTLQFVLTDGRGGTSANVTKTIDAIAVNDPPILTVPAAQTVNQNANLTIAGISVTDLDVGSGNLQVTISATNGVLTLSSTVGLTFTTGNGNSNSIITVFGSLTNINNALNNLVYRGNAGFNGIDTIALTVTDGGNTGTGAVGSDSKAIAVNITQPASGLLRLTNDANSQKGSTTRAIAATLTPDASFNTQFRFRLHDGDRAGGADGFAFAIKDAAAANINALAGGYLNYQQDLTGTPYKSVAVEFDTYQNDWDVNGNHVAVLRDGSVTNQLAIATPAFTLNDDRPYDAWIEYNGNNKELRVYLSDNTIKPATPLLSFNIDIPAAVGSNAIFDFVAATGSLRNVQDIGKWQFATGSDSSPTIPAAGSGIVVNNFSNLQVNGSAAIGDILRLTDDTNSSSGSAFLAAPIAIGTNSYFTTRFQFQLQGQQGSLGGDGFVFTLQDTTAGAASVGLAGGYLGYYKEDAIARSLAIEFDTYKNEWDVNDNHIAILRDGFVTDRLAQATPDIDLNSGNVINTWIEYERGTLRIFLAQSDRKPIDALLSYNIDLSAAVGSQAFVGFAGATGNLRNAQDILNWQYTQGNIIDGTTGNDALTATGINDKLFGYDGDDVLNAIAAGGNILTGGAGADRFQIVRGGIVPNVVNTIADFQQGVDVVAIAGLAGVTEIGNLNITQDGANTLIKANNTDLAILTGIQAASLNNSSFAFI